MLSPAKVMIIGSRPFDGQHVKQYPERFASYDFVITNGFPTDEECRRFLDGLTHILRCETPYSMQPIAEADRRGIKSYIQHNVEFRDHLNRPELPRPTMFLSPSAWHLDVMEAKFPGLVKLLPPPIFLQDFARARAANIGRRGKRRFLFVLGKPAHGDRNGVMLLMDAMHHSRTDFELVVKSQEPTQLLRRDRRIIWDHCAPEEQQTLYEGFDALIMPRRYGGLCLPMNEALTSGPPVIMSDTSQQRRCPP